jgi:hypothetical protein
MDKLSIFVAGFLSVLIVLAGNAAILMVALYLSMITILKLMDIHETIERKKK